MAMNSLLQKSFWALAAGVFAYLLSILALTIPTIQRNALYAHKVNPTYWQNLSDVEQFGFLHHQVQPFTLTTPDNVTLYCWHILPLHLFYQHEEELTAQSDFGLKDFHEATSTKAFELLKSDQNTHVVLNFHGNAAHLASSYRPTTYNMQLGLSTPERPVHVIAFDYRGFGLSTGHPTEEGLITDASELLTALTGLSPISPKSEHISVLPLVPAHRIILFGQSLGTAVSTGVFHRWTIIHNLPAPKALVLTSAFTSLLQLLDAYSLKGIIPPLLSPLSPYPRLKSWITSHIADTWPTSSRIADLVAQIPSLDLTLLHAGDDLEIPWTEGWGNWLSAMGAVKRMKEQTGHGGYYLMAEGEGEKIRTGRYPGDVLWTDGEGRVVQWERCPRGGHNRLAAGNRAALAVQRVLEGRG